MAKQFWLCDKCNSKYHKESDASECELSHPTIDQISIYGIGFESLDDRHGVNRGLAERYPKSVTLKLSDNYGDFATYERVRIGFKGM